MPTYDYYCEECTFYDEFFHAMNEKPEYKCPVCGKKLYKAITGCNIGMSKISLDLERCAEKAIKRSEMQRDLRENFGIEELRMVQNSENKNYEDAYNDIKTNPQMVKEHMAATKQQQRAKLKEKQEKRKLSSEEIERRKKVIVEKRKEQQYEKRKITTTSQ